MGREKNLFDSPQAEERSEARAVADVAQGRLISHDAVRQWLASWGREKRLAKPRPGD